MAMEISEIVDRESLEAYLEEQPKQVSQAVALRAALQVFPRLDQAWENPKLGVEKARLLTFTSFCALQVSWATLCWPTHDTQAAAAAAAHDANAYAAVAYAAAAYAANAANAYAAAAYAAANAAYAAYAYDAAAVWDDMRSFLRKVQNGEATDFLTVVSSVLWGENTPPDIAENWQNLRSRLLAEDPNWVYWLNWYDARLRGEPARDEELHIKVAQIDETDWKQGAAHVNAMIAGFYRTGLRQRTPNAEEMIWVETDQRYEFRPLPPKDRYNYDAIISRVRYAMKDLQARGLGQTNASLDEEFEILERAFERFAAHPLEMYTSFAKVALRVAHKFESTGEFNNEDHSVRDFGADVQSAAIDLMTFEPDVAKAVQARSQVKYVQPTAKESDELKAVFDQAKKLLGPDQAEQMSMDWNTIQAGFPNGSSEYMARGASFALSNEEAIYRASSRLIRLAIAELEQRDAYKQDPDTPFGPRFVLEDGMLWKLYFWKQIG